MTKLFYVETEEFKKKSENIIKRILEEYLNTKEILVIKTNEHGKPYLSDYPDVNYNISHTKDIVVCGISDNPIGVDVEEVKRFNKNLIRRFFTKNEQKYIFSSQEYQIKRFTEIWTKKEAYVKFIGKGIAVSFDSFDVLSDVRIKTYSILYKRWYITVCGDDVDKNDISMVKISL